MNKLTQVFFFLCFALSLNAQDKFSYLEDRIFRSYNEIIGYNFVPSVMEIPNEYDEELSPGEYSFGVTRANLYVDGPEVKGVYNINQSDDQPYGYKLALMNSRDPTAQGHLKIIVNKNNHVEALIFKKDKDAKEIIFFIGETPDRIIKKEETYFTDKFEMNLDAPDSIWNKTIYPFISIENKFQGRLEVSDSTSIAFIETVKVTEKKKRAKKGRKKDKEITEEAKETLTEEEVMIAEDKAAMEELGLETAEVEEGEEEVKVKIEKDYFIEIKQKLKLEDGTEEDKVWNYPIKKVVEREDESARTGQPRYEVDFTTNKGDHILLYLTGKRTITSIQFTERKFLMRGN